MKRRELITLLGGAAAASCVSWPLTARAQQPAMPVIGFLSGQSPGTFAPHLAAFHQGLKQTGYIEGRNVAIEYRWAEGQPDRLPGLAADLVQRRVAVISATGGLASSLAAKAATATVPIVFNIGGDPVKAGLVTSLNRPGGNVTGVSWFNAELTAKRLALLHELVPGAGIVAMLVNPREPDARTQLADVQDAARVLGRRAVIVNAATADEIDAAFAALVQQRAAALVVASDPSYLNRRDQIIALAARHAMPTIYSNRDYVTAGGLMSYGNNLPDAYRRNGIYAGRILKGDKPGDLPVDQSTRFELVINLETVKALGLDLPLALQIRVDEVIE
jgi:putative tryptophan/tyrosine transport system substrate-binding protein